MTGILQPLIRSNISLLKQKIALLDLLVARYGSVEASEKFKTVCPLVGASIGQHYRHSMDHVELAALIASSARNNSYHGSDASEVHYDLRVRGGTLETDLDLSRKRIVDVVEVFRALETEDENVTRIPIDAYHMLSADSDKELALQSTIGRELGFCAHHSIHHMFMVKVIAVHTLCWNDGEFPHGFGKAPSTHIFDAK